MVLPCLLIPPSLRRPPLDSSLGFVPDNSRLSAASKTVTFPMARTNAREVTGQCQDGSSTNRVFAALGFFHTARSSSAIPWFELLEQFQKFFVPSAGPTVPAPQVQQLHAAFFGEQLSLAAQALTHGQRVQSW